MPFTPINDPKDTNDSGTIKAASGTDQQNARFESPPPSSQTAQAVSPPPSPSHLAPVTSCSGASHPRHTSPPTALTHTSQHFEVRTDRLATLQTYHTPVQALGNHAHAYNTTSTRQLWTKEEEELLLQLRAQKPTLTWDQTAQHFPGKTGNACRKKHCRLNEERARRERQNLASAKSSAITATASSTSDPSRIIDTLSTTNRRTRDRSDNPISFRQFRYFVRKLIELCGLPEALSSILSEVEEEGNHDAIHREESAEHRDKDAGSAK